MHIMVLITTALIIINILLQNIYTIYEYNNGGIFPATYCL